MGRLTKKGSSSALRRALFPAGFAGEVMTLIHETWQSFAMHHQVKLEDRITAVFAQAMIDEYTRRNWPWFILTEIQITDPTFGTQTGRNDLRFYHRYLSGQDTYFTVECKRLHVRTSSGFKHLADKYVDEGLARFADDKYAAGQPCGGMVGYVMDNDVDTAFNRVKSEILSKLSPLKMKDAKTLRNPSSVFPNHLQSADTRHRRTSGYFKVHHLLVGVSN